jgi:hypothetical protein
MAMIRLASESTICTRIYEVQPAPKFHIIPFVASLLICSFACNLSAGTPLIRLSIQANCPDCDKERMVSALSHEFRKLDGVSVTDTQPALKISCGVMRLTDSAGNMMNGYAASVAVTSIDDRFITHYVLTDGTIEKLAHRIAIAIDGGVIEQMRRDAQPSSSP